MFVVGVDGCRAGWLAVALDEAENWETKLFTTIDDLWAAYQSAALILIDVPIGLPDKQDPQRECDREARRVLGRQRQSSVFPPPSRAALVGETYEEASDINDRAIGKRLTRQAWGTVPRIREVDALLRRNPRARATFRESHPEVCFWALNKERPLAQSKRAEDGRKARENILAPLYPQARVILRVAQSRFAPAEVSTDDVLDALALAVTAMLGREALHSLPETPPRDERWLPMEIVYWPLQPAAALAASGT